ncbi:MAG: hypothetical protein GX627_01285 [Parcubacteria group bacterium]|nr:hypothetical protein [Parcubacteria group bacterium]
MLPKKQRIPRKMFPLLSSKEGTTLENELFNFKFVFSKEPNSRFCFSVSKKISKSAVVRNRIRRTSYRILSKKIDDIKVGIIAVFRFKKLPKNNDEIESNITLILKKLKTSFAKRNK